jgi:hypothetical protein
LKLSTVNKTVFRDRETVESLSISVQYEASAEPSFTWYNNRDQVLFSETKVLEGFESKHVVKITSNQVELMI